MVATCAQSAAILPAWDVESCCGFVPKSYSMWFQWPAMGSNVSVTFQLVGANSGESSTITLGNITHQTLVNMAATGLNGSQACTIANAPYFRVIPRIIYTPTVTPTPAGGDSVPVTYGIIATE